MRHGDGSNSAEAELIALGSSSRYEWTVYPSNVVTITSQGGDTSHVATVRVDESAVEGSCVVFSHLRVTARA